jgi:hypothetical protein
MNPRIWKEVRSLLPAFTVPVAATMLVAVIFDGRDAAGIVSFVFVGGCVMMGSCSFGNEFYTRTMTALLAQPVSRRQLWAEKMRVLGIGLALASLAWFFSVEVLIRGEGRPENITEVALTMLLVPVIAFCSAPLISLMSKNILGSMALTALMPVVVWLLILAADWLVSCLFSQSQVFLANSFDKWSGFYIAGLAFGYSVAAYVAGWKYFLRFESLDSRGTEIKIPDQMESRLAPLVKRLIPGYSGPFASLIRKELGLQQVSYIMAGLLCLWLLCAATAWAIHPGEFTNVLLCVPFVLYVLMIPLITGLVCMAEERNLGTANWQFTLPPSATNQWSAKILVTLSTCLGLGVVLPLILLLVWKGLSGTHFVLPFSDAAPVALIAYILGYLSLFSLVIYASSISTNSMRAILACLGLLIGAAGMVALVGYVVMNRLNQGYTSGSFHLLIKGLRKWVTDVAANHEWESYVIEYVMFWAVPVVLGCLAFWFFRMASINFRNGELNPRRIRRQLSWIFAATGVLSLIGSCLVFIVQHVNDDLIR